MNSQTLSSLIDKAITDALAHRTLRIESSLFESTGIENIHAETQRQPTTFVLITGDDVAAFPATLHYLAALAQAGCQLSVHFSHSACTRVLPTPCIVCCHRCLANRLLIPCHATAIRCCCQPCPITVWQK
ncbi:MULTISPECIES: hypothetical protein [Symbiopectobacterium]|uniref:hypothetical protein n=1 Tax=Symbiopectobacterium TaxID=801 RepID=UPI001A243C92|nr:MULTISPECIES: hypothetical protein [Symbiopectobacterium]MBG6248113.1 hypothetical protein [Candidatus Symbiopectobacterium sp. PLON1]MBT9430604.1 hypothetical protein [Candidatus Symbiopectobacterium endolongispinus]